MAALYSRTIKIIILLASFLVAETLIYEAPRASISEYYEDTYYENVRPIRLPRNGDVIVGEQTTNGVKRLLFECSASYPVQWIYTGDGVPEISTDTNVKRNQGNSLNGDYGATLQINELTEGHTGNYTCRGTQNRNSFVSYHLYVPGERIFPSPGNQNVTFSNRDSSVMIPCSVSHPSARVSLQRMNNGYVKCPLNNSAFFDPKKGFTLRIQEIRDPAGEYLCTGSLNGNVKVVAVRLVQQFETIRSKCNPNPCGVNAECLLARGREVCTCISGFTGDPFVQCRRVIGGLDPCNPSPCGQYGDCVVRNGLAACRCRPGYQGKPPHCTSATTRCYIHQDCQPNEMCIQRQCTSSCNNHRCGRNAQCQVVNRTPVCSCPPGFLGDGYKDCVQDRFTAPYEELEERLRPECINDGECPRFLACIHQKCQNPCPSVCGPSVENCYVNDHKAVCNGIRINCPPGDSSCAPHRGAIGGCQRTNCGPNSECKDNSGQAVCSCLPGHTGTPPHCSTICFGNSGCPSHMACQARKCQDPCNGHICGTNSKCVVKQHKPECECHQGFGGDPKTGCSPTRGTLLTPACPLRCGSGLSCKFVGGTPTCTIEQSCFSDTDCPTNSGCFNGECKNPCEVFQTLCGENQRCAVVNHKAECECKPGFPVRINNDCYTDGFQERSFNADEEADNHFHRGAHCVPPYCRTGDPRAEENRCRFSGDCRRNEMCVNFRCIGACGACGANAECRMDIDGLPPKCVCPPGYFGSPKIRCYPLFRQSKTEEAEVIALNDTKEKMALDADNVTLLVPA